MDFKKEDFLKMRYNVYKLDNEIPFKRAFPELAIYPEFDEKSAKVNGLRLTQIMRFICFAYDKNSPLMSYDRPWHRKAVAIDLAGFPRVKSGKFHQHVEMLINNSYASVNRMVVRFLRIQNSTDFQTMMTYDEKLQDVLVKLFDPTQTEDGDKDSELLKNSEMLRKTIAELRNDFFLGEQDAKLSATLYDELENEQLELRPEQIAKKIKNKDMDDIWSMMPQNYVKY